MKLLLTSPDALINTSTGDFFDGIENALKRFLLLDKNNKVVTVSMHKDKLDRIHKSFNPLAIKGNLRGSPKFISLINEKLGYDYADIIVLGAKIKDLAQAANSKLLLLSAKYAQVNNPDDRFYKKDYGIPISNAAALSLFFERFSNIEDPWYYKLELPPITTVYALTNANTFGTGRDAAVINTKFRALLKDGQSDYLGPFTNFFIVSVYKIYKEVKEIDYWGVYPTSSGKVNEDLNYFLTKVRESFGAPKNEPLLLRHTPSEQRHKTGSSEKRIANGCDEQFKTITLNPIYKGKLEGTSVCIIDDFTTYGTSVETVRNLLGRERVKRIIFIALGKFGKEYYKYKYKIEGDLFSKYIYQKLKNEHVVGHFNPNANKEFLESIKGLV